MNRIFLLIGMSLLLVSCGSEDTQKSQTPPPTPEKPKDSIASAPADYMAEAIRAGQATKGKVEIIAIEKAITQFQADEGRYPSSLQELVEKGQLAQLPKPPVNQKFEYDSQSGAVKLVAE
jgi:hypothetical protein